MDLVYITEFLDFYKSQESAYYLKVSNQTSSNLPPVFTEPPIVSAGVLWIDVPDRHDADFKEGFSMAINILKDLETKCSGAVIHDGGVLENVIDEIDWPKNVEWSKIHLADEFNGSEADIVIVALKNVGIWSFDAFTRGRKLLMIITNSYTYSIPQMLEKAAERKCLRKLLPNTDNQGSSDINEVS